MGDRSDTEQPSMSSLLATSARWAESPGPEVVNVLANLVQAYAIFTDNAVRHELASLFTPDAKWDGTELGYGVAEGPDAIAATVLQHFDPERPMVARALRPHPSDDPRARTTAPRRGVRLRGARCGLVPGGTTGGDRTAPLIYFHYDDEFRRDDAGTVGGSPAGRCVCGSDPEGEAMFRLARHGLSRPFSRGSSPPSGSW